jgi:POT family proton-dependent oligopeptide transporter
MSRPNDAIDNPSSGTWFGHPRQLTRLFTTEMWERFGFYGMRALLTLYLVKHFQFTDATANGLYGAFTSLVYLTPLFGGLLADQILGYKRSVKFGAIMMAIGYFALCFGGEMARPYLELNGQRHAVTLAKPQEGQEESEKLVTLDGTEYRVAGQENDSLKLEAVSTVPADQQVRLLAKGTYRFDGERDPFWVNFMFLSLAFVIVGNGFFKPNISTIVGSLYAKGDTRRDGGFTIFYIGINLGSAISQFLCPIFQAEFGFWAGFLLAAVGMLCAWALFQFDGGRLRGYGESKEGSWGKSIIVFIGAIVAIPVIWWLLHNTMLNAEGAAQAAEEGGGIVGYILALPLLGKVLFAVCLLAVIGIPIWSFMAGTREEAQKMVVAVILVIFSVVFWMLFEQAGSSLTLYADRNTDLVIYWTKPLFSMFVNYPITKYVLPLVIASVVSYVVYWAFSRGGDARDRRNVGLVAAGIFLIMSVTMILAARQVDSDQPYVMPAAQTQIFNPIFIVLFAPVLSWLWVSLGKRGLEPSIPIKFSIGLFLVGLGFLTLVYGAQFANEQFRIALFWLGLAYFFHSIGELCLSPVGLSMITKLSIARVVGLMMGVWFLSSAMAQYVAGIVAQFASSETVGGEVTDPEQALQTYVNVFMYIGIAGIVSGAVLFVLSFLLTKWMHGVK